MELSISFLIKIVLGIVAIGFVIYGVAFAVKGNLDIFPSMNESNSVVSQPVSSGNSVVSKCDQCGLWCTEKECLGLGNCNFDRKLLKFGKCY